MSSMYPSLEDMKFHQLAVGQNKYFAQQAATSTPSPFVHQAPASAPNYPAHGIPPPVYQHSPTVPSYPIGQYPASAPNYPIVPNNPNYLNHSSSSNNPSAPNYPNLSNPNNYNHLTAASNPNAPSYPSNPYYPSSNSNLYPSVPTVPQTRQSFPPAPSTAPQPLPRISLPSHTAYPISPLTPATNSPAYNATSNIPTPYTSAPSNQGSAPSNIPSPYSSAPSNNGSAPSTNASAPSAPEAPSSLVPSAPSRDLASLYPCLDNYMGLELASEIINEYKRENEANSRLPIDEASSGTLTSRSGGQRESTACTMIAPLSGTGVLKKALVTNGIRELILCKDGSGKVGLRVCALSEGVFVSLVEKSSPAALVGLRFGDQILSVNDESVAGYSMKQVNKLFKAAAVNDIRVVVRDRPFERNVTLHKDSSGRVGFQFKAGQVFRLVKDSSATRNGLLVDHQILEVNGVNVVGLKDKELRDMIDASTPSLTLTIMPSFVFQHMMKKMSASLVKNKMDHSF